MPGTLKGSRRQSREAALQALYLIDVCRVKRGEFPAGYWSEEPLTPKALQFAEHLVAGTLAELEPIDQTIMRYAKNWELDRMAAVDRSLLRLAAFELLRDLETPVNVIINEAIEIAKQYSTAESSKFVNGILDKVKEERKSP